MQKLILKNGKVSYRAKVYVPGKGILTKSDSSKNKIRTLEAGLKFIKTK